MKAIIYTTNTGSTAQYAKMLAEQTGLPAFSMEEAKSKVEAGSEIIYLGWIMAAQVKGYKAAAKKYKIRGTEITLSREQYKAFKQKIQEESLENYLTVELMDYRDLPKMGKQFDRVVSIGMVEHVGRENYQLFNDCINKVLKDGGL